ncbi:MAG: deoxyhypusine synthase family protein, partial [Planctomycetota bacterium]
MSIREFMTTHYRHFNAATVVDAAQGWEDLLGNSGKMMVTLAGAMSTAELGRSLAEMIRQGKVHAITCTGANLEEDLFNLVAHEYYERVPNWRELSPQDEQSLLERGMNRVTDTCIPEEEAFRRVEHKLEPLWKQAGETGTPRFPHEFLYELLVQGAFSDGYSGSVENCWLMAAAQKNLPLYVPGWEDSTLGNVCAARSMQGVIPPVRDVVRSGLEYMQHLVAWYTQTA